MNPLSLSPEEVSEWTDQAQAIAKLMDAHFEAFNVMEAEPSKRKRKQYNKALGTIRRAACHIRGIEVS